MEDQLRNALIVLRRQEILWLIGNYPRRTILKLLRNTLTTHGARIAIIMEAENRSLSEAIAIVECLEYIELTSLSEKM
jgi:hypothetical protein